MRAIARALRTLLLDASRLDQVLLLSHLVNMPTLMREAERVAATPEGRALFASQPRISRATVDFDALARLPDGTLGREYVRFLDKNKISPDTFDGMPEVADPKVAYLMLRFRQTHDLWHVLTGYQADVRGEVLLQAFMFPQTRAPSNALIAIFGSLRHGWRWPRHLQALRDAVERGAKGELLVAFPWEEHWETPVSELRARLVG